MEIECKSLYSSYGQNLKFFSDVNLKYFLDLAKYCSVSSFDQAFHFQALTLSGSQHMGDSIENVFGGGAEGVARRECKPYLKHLQRVVSTLPAGIAVEIKDYSSVDRYRSGKFFKLYIEVEVSVSAEYSKSCYSSINECGIVHDFNISTTMKNTARAFKERIMLSHNDLLYSIMSICDGKYSERVFFNQECYHASGTAPVDDNYSQLSTKYKHHGMKDLCSIEQCYGLAWAIAELSVPSVRCRISIKDELRYSDGKPGYQKVVCLDRFQYRKKIEAPQFADW